MVESLQMFLFLFKSKYRRKFCWFSPFLCSVLIVLLLFCLGVYAKCSEQTCLNGLCKNDTCECNEGWQGSECQYCGGKIRLTEPRGYITDGPGNYSVGIKCSWLIDARNLELDNTVPEVGPVRPPSIRLHFEEFATECGWDHLYIYDGDSIDSPLLAVFSGIMYSDNYSIRNSAEIVARSGSLLLHFFSDDAYHMSGFNISYVIGACPSRHSSTNCSGNGRCDNTGRCHCYSGWFGEACYMPVCPENCTSSAGGGVCLANGCKCEEGHVGEDCSQPDNDLVVRWLWRDGDGSDTITSGRPQPQLAAGFRAPGAASAAAAVWRDSFYILGGYGFRQRNVVYTYDFNGGVWESVVTSGPTPRQRYAASAALHGDKIYLYGGVIEEHDGIASSVTSELWALDVSARSWENVTVQTSCQPRSLCGPLALAGHTATSVRLSGHDVMIVLFGHSPKYGYMSTVQEFWLGTREWKVALAKGYPVRGGYGHSASYDSLTNRIYVYGGIVSESESGQITHGALYSYEPQGKVWTLLAPGPSPRHLHLAAFVSPGIMLVIGGNAHNDTSHSRGSRCYSAEVLTYDVICDEWRAVDVGSSRDGLARFGSAGTIFEGSLYSWGGWDGRARSDIVRIAVGKCSGRATRPSCTASPRKAGVKCAWDQNKHKCMPISEILDELLVEEQDTVIDWWKDTTIMENEKYTICGELGRARATQKLLENKERCAAQWSCSACTSTSAGCSWCAGTCLAQHHHHHHHMQDITEASECNDNAAVQCARLHSCAACLALTPNQPEPCHWDYEAGKCRPGNVTLPEAEASGSSPAAVDPSSSPPAGCPSPCASLATCAACARDECMWCAPRARCVDRNAYAAAFPYGACREWTTQAQRCRPHNANHTVLAGDLEEECSSLETCFGCRSEAGCGWCDSGQGNGQGECMPGGAAAPRSPRECPNHRWHFTTCPRCQCNGHAVCMMETDEDEGEHCLHPCAGRATGEHCETCAPGFWGSPLNGGVCKPCECNSQAVSCHPESGRCYCTTKGLAGDHCDKCDATNHYHSDPANPATRGACYYDLAIDYQFTFNLSKKEDRHFTQINFRNSPMKADVDADFSITCSVHAKLNVSARTAGGPERPLLNALNCTSFRYRFSKSEHMFGIEDNVTLTTFYVYVYDFQPPLWIQISFSQYPKLNLQQFFITFSCCFLLLLLVAGVLWKIKQKYDLYRRRQRLFVEMEQMASRPFSQVSVELEYAPTPIFGSGGLTGAAKRRKDPPSPIALEPCSGNKAAVLSLLVRLPSGSGTNAGTYAPSGAAGLAVASALVTLGAPPRLNHAHHHTAHLTADHDDKHKRKGDRTSAAIGLTPHHT